MNQEITGTEENVRVPVMQRILDNPFLLLFIGVVVPTVFLHRLGNHGTLDHSRRTLTTTT